MRWSILRGFPSSCVRWALLLPACALLGSALAAQVVLASDPVAAASDNGHHVVRDSAGTLWSLSVFDDGTGWPGNRPLLLQSSADGGQTWTPHVFTFNDCYSGVNPPWPASGCNLAIDSAGTLHAVWASYHYFWNYRQYYRNFNPATGAASRVLSLTAHLGLLTTTYATEMAIAVDAADTVWIAAQGVSPYAPQLVRSNLPGAPDLRFTSVGKICPYSYASGVELAVDAAGNIHCSYSRSGSPGVYQHRHYKPSANTWGAPTTLGNTTSVSDNWGKIAADALGNVHAVYLMDCAPGPGYQWKLRYKRWNIVTGWGPEVVIFNAYYATYFLASSHQLVSLACREATGKVSIMYRDRTSFGAWRLAEKNLTAPSFTILPNAMPVNSASAYYRGPSVRGSLFPLFNNTDTDLDFTWQAMTVGTWPPALMFQRISSAPATLSLSAPPTIGTIKSINLSSPADPNAGFVCAVSMGSTPGIALPDLRVIPLNADSLLFMSLTPANGVLANNIATLSSAGTALVNFTIPNLPSLIGLTVQAAFVVAAPGTTTGISTISPALPITFQ